MITESTCVAKGALSRTIVGSQCQEPNIDPAMDSSGLTIVLVPMGPEVQDMPYVKFLANNGAESLRLGRLVNDGFERWNTVVDDEQKSKLVIKATIFSSLVPYWESWNDGGDDPEHEVMNDWACGKGAESSPNYEEVGDPEDNFKKLYAGIAKLADLVNLKHAGLAFMCECMTGQGFGHP